MTPHFEHAFPKLYLKICHVILTQGPKTFLTMHKNHFSIFLKFPAFTEASFMSGYQLSELELHLYEAYGEHATRQKEPLLTYLFSFSSPKHQNSILLVFCAWNGLPCIIYSAILMSIVTAHLIIFIDH